MVLDSKIARLREHFGIHKPEDWQGVTPEWVLAVPEVGPQTLNHLRLQLAARGLTLRNDQTPAFWQQHLSSDKLGTSQLDGADAAVICPFTLLVDSQEKNPFTFAGNDPNFSSGPKIRLPHLVSSGFLERCRGYLDF